jgi:hypothetical protein
MLDHEPKIVVQRRKNQMTGTMVVVATCWALDLEPEDDFVWVTLCEDHGGLVYHPSKTTAKFWAAHPDEWCPVCQGEED